MSDQAKEELRAEAVHQISQAITHARRAVRARRALAAGEAITEQQRASLARTEAALSEYMPGRTMDDLPELIRAMRDARTLLRGADFDVAQRPQRGSNAEWNAAAPRVRELRSIIDRDERDVGQTGLTAETGDYFVVLTLGPPSESNRSHVVSDIVHEAFHLTSDGSRGRLDTGDDSPYRYQGFIGDLSGADYDKRKVALGIAMADTFGRTLPDFRLNTPESLQAPRFRLELK